MAKNRKNPGQNRRGISFFSGLFFLAGLAVLVMIGISLGKETYRKRQIQKENEKMIGLRKDVGPKNTAPGNGDAKNGEAPEDNTPNWKKWLELFFSKKN